MSPPTLLVVDDEATIRDTLKRILLDNGYESVETVESGSHALARMSSTPPPDVVITDVKMKGMDGLELLERLRESDPTLPVIIFSGHGTVQLAVEATRRGAFDFLEKPPDVERLLISVRNALATRSKDAKVRELNERVAALADSVAGKWKILGRSQATSYLRKQIGKAGPTEARVLITGEHGTGKELVARNLHLLSPRNKGPFIEVNCAALPDHLTESELFGHEKGAFTGAERQHRGKFEQAHGGTLFLDEIGDMPLSTQAKLLRVLEDGRITRVGGKEAIEVDVRIIAATNKDLASECAEHHFREDLYSRLDAVRIDVPPLRERREDIPEIFGAMFAREVARAGRTDIRLADSAFAPMLRSDWAGNVRQLRNLAERVASMADPGEVTDTTIESMMSRAPRRDASGWSDILELVPLDRFEDECRRRYIVHHLRENNDNASKTAEAIATARSNLYKMMDRLGISRSGFGP